MSNRSNTNRIVKLVSSAVVLGAIAFGAGCGPQKYLTFQVWEGPSKASEAKKKFVGGIGGYHDQVWEMLGKNDVDGAIKLIEGDANKGWLDYYNLAVLYEVKHDWVKAEEACKKGQEDYAKSFPGKTDDDLAAELAFIQAHKAIYTPQPAAAAPAAQPAPAAPAGPTPISIPGH